MSSISHLPKPAKVYPDKTAGKIMIPKEEVPQVLLDTSLVAVEKLLRSRATDYESINYVYVTDAADRLLGVFSIKDLYKQMSDDGQAGDIMQTEVISIRTHTHQERSALLALKHSIKALPVIDKDGVLQGVIPFDTILKILDQEAVEDILHFGGIHFSGAIDDIQNLSTIQSIKHRLPWLLAGLLGGILAAGVIGGFEKILSEHIILAAFIPLIVYMADAVGTQMQSFIIRDLATSSHFNFFKYLKKQIGIVSIIGFILSAVLALIGLLFYNNGLVGIVLGISLFCAVLTSLFSGLTVPYLFSKFNLDPANASGPTATIIQDILSILVYFTVATLLL